MQQNLCCSNTKQTTFVINCSISWKKKSIFGWIHVKIVCWRLHFRWNGCRVQLTAMKWFEQVLLAAKNGAEKPFQDAALRYVVNVKNCRARKSISFVTIVHKKWHFLQSFCDKITWFDVAMALLRYPTWFKMHRVHSNGSWCLAFGRALSWAVHLCHAAMFKEIYYRKLKAI